MREFAFSYRRIQRVGIRRRRVRSIVSIHGRPRVSTKISKIHLLFAAAIFSARGITNHDRPFLFGSSKNLLTRPRRTHTHTYTPDACLTQSAAYIYGAFLRRTVFHFHSRSKTGKIYCSHQPRYVVTYIPISPTNSRSPVIVYRETPRVTRVSNPSEVERRKKR